MQGLPGPMKRLLQSRWYVSQGAVGLSSGNHKKWKSSKGNSYCCSAACPNYLIVPEHGATCHMLSVQWSNHFVRDGVKRWKKLVCIVIDATRHYLKNEVGDEISVPVNSARQQRNLVLPIVTVYIDSASCLVLQNSALKMDCEHPKLCRSWSKQGMAVTTITGALQTCCGKSIIRIHTATGNSATIDVLGIWGEPLNFNLLLGINAIKALGSIYITQYGSMKFEETWPFCAVICISKDDLSAKFEERQGVWVAAWKWSAGCAPEKLWNRISEYPVLSRLREEHQHELQT